MSDDSTTTINLTEAQADWAEWAVLRLTIVYLAMLDEGEIQKLPDLPEVESTIMHLPLGEEILTALLKLLEDDAPERVKESNLPDSAANEPIRLAKKIRAVTGYRGLAA